MLRAFCRRQSRRGDSNPWPTLYKSVALPTELLRPVLTSLGAVESGRYAWDAAHLPVDARLGEGAADRRVRGERDVVARRPPRPDGQPGPTRRDRVAARRPR